jgi:UDPglucose 6-dehydrogenase
MKISIVGLGKLGLPIMGVFKKAGHKVIGIDKKLPKTYHFGYLGAMTFVIVPTPSLMNKKFTSEYVEDVLSKIHKKQTIVIVSTVMPGETDRLQREFKHLTLIYSPTFVALGTVAKDFTHPDFVLVGSRYPKATTLLKKLYSTVMHKPRFAVLTPLEAEIAKLALNCYITTKITFANQIGNLCDRIGIGPFNICKAIGMDSRIGSKYFSPGLGYGGPCFPRDNLALSAYMRDNGLYPELSETVHNLNERQIDEIVDRILLKDPKIVGFSGLSYKKESDVMECSQLFEIWKRLKKKDIRVILGNGDVNLNWGGICEKSIGNRLRRIHRNTPCETFETGGLLGSGCGY